MELAITPQALLVTLLIFVLRVTDMSLDTLRVLFVMRGKKSLAWVLGFFQSAIFVLAISSVLANLDNPLNVIAYAAGFATGNVIGISIEERLAIGHTHMNIVSSRRGDAVARALRDQGYAVTEISGRGKDGTVTVLSVSVLRKSVDQTTNLVLEIDPSAFVTTEDVRAVHRGFWRA